MRENGINIIVIDWVSTTLYTLIHIFIHGYISCSCPSSPYRLSFAFLFPIFFLLFLICLSSARVLRASACILAWFLIRFSNRSGGRKPIIVGDWKCDWIYIKLIGVTKKNYWRFVEGYFILLTMLAGVLGHGLQARNWNSENSWLLQAHRIILQSLNLYLFDIY